MEKDAIRIEQEHSNHPSLSKFIDEMLPSKLFFQFQSLEFGSCRKWWVFWNHNESEISSINYDLHDRIRTCLCCFSFLMDTDLLIQFWAPEETGGRLHLTTTLQPFALSNLENEKLRRYRKHCAGYKLYVQDEESSGIVGRVFRNQLHEFGPDLKDYSVWEYPQRDFASSCGIICTVVMPVFEHSSGNPCVGVLELLVQENHYSYISLYDSLADTPLEDHHLRTTFMVSFNDQIICKSHIQNEIQTAVEHVCKKYYLSLGVTWVSSKHICPSRSYNEPQLSLQGELLAAIPKMSYARDTRNNFVEIWTTLLRVNQGLVGKVFSSGNLDFCEDVCQLSITEYPFVNLARKFGIAACFAFCLRNISTGNNELVIEFSLSRKDRMIHGRDLYSLISPIMATMSQKLKDFEIVTGDMENKVVTEVPTQKEESDNGFTSGKDISTPTTSEGDSFQSLRTTECSMNSTCRQSFWPSLKHANESDQFIPETSSHVIRTAHRAESGEGNSETASTKLVKVSGFTMHAIQPELAKLNQSTREISSPPLSEASAIRADVEMITNVEMMTIKVSYKEDIIKFDLPPSSSYEDLRENILHRWGFLKEKSFVIKYLNDSREKIILATDMDLQECMVWTRSKGEKLIRMVIQLEEVVP